MAKIIVKIENGVSAKGNQYSKLVHYVVDDKGNEYVFGDDVFLQEQDKSILKLVGINYDEKK